MSGYRVDFAMNRGHEMIIDRETGIERDDLDQIELQMLSSQQVPYMLPVDWFELDGKITFRYKLDGMKMLSHRLQQQSLTMAQYYSLILGITDALGECKHYMLRSEGCVLHEQFIFVGEHLHDVKLVYLPIKSGAGERPFGAGDLMSIIVRFTSYVEHIDGNGLKLLLGHLSGSKWPLTELRASLLELIGGEGRMMPMGPLPEEERPAIRKSNRTAPSPLLSPEFEPEPDRSREQIGIQAGLADVSDDHVYMPYIGEEPGGKPSIRKWLTTAVLAVAAACGWRFIYLEAYTLRSLLISTGLTLLSAALVIWVWRNEDAERNKWETEQEDEDEEEEDGFSGDRRNPFVRAYDEPAAQPSYDPLFVASPSEPVPPSDPTVMLGHADRQHVENRHEVWLQRSWEGQLSRIDIAEGSLKIGRTGGQISYADTANGISRLHLEIECADGEHLAKDLGSRNGSLLNGQAMIAYKAYKLAIGDVIQLAGLHGPSYELKSG
ncbi:FHA domain-containing protein [Paenibacillus sp. N4]|uniref:DUF6382 domain-containing protein n=1 Tax=Paenibacillus vietnamensis TaxID=2590547 RepID=UPI001CD1759B|nr:DUF6382 domain-containing protein [Paenibacillus vietnamensis]MCA0757416.1 FHA domain-containing protein [Paenibacillus vietnamensis]